jgi:UDP-N-acetylmuramate: L-alanyl-gamma-D-glutamyl-meso-diaminopimelate ligase
MLAARHAGVEIQTAVSALREFKGVRRRMEVRGVVDGITVYDDFAHHPTAIELTLAGLRSKVDGARIVAVLEPRSNTMKLGAMKEALAASLQRADRVYCYSAGLTWDADAALRPLGDRVSVCGDFDQMLNEIVRGARPGDHVLVMSNGGFEGIHDKLLAALKAR